jgi:hypothetical protein
MYLSIAHKKKEKTKNIPPPQHKNKKTNKQTPTRKTYEIVYGN